MAVAESHTGFDNRPADTAVVVAAAVVACHCTEAATPATDNLPVAAEAVTCHFLVSPVPAAADTTADVAAGTAIERKVEAGMIPDGLVVVEVVEERSMVTMRCSALLRRTKVSQGWRTDRMQEKRSKRVGIGRDGEVAAGNHRRILMISVVVEKRAEVGVV